MASDRAYVELPGDANFLRTHAIPNRRVDLPLVAGPRRGMMRTRGIYFVAFGLICIWLVYKVLPGVLNAAALQDVRTFVVALALGVTGLVGVALVLVGETYLTDSAMTGNVLELGAEGLHDARLKLTLPWSAVAYAKVIAGQGGLIGLSLGTRDPVDARTGFRIITLRWRRPANEIAIPLGLLSVPARTLAQVALTLVREHGGEVDPTRLDGVTLAPLLPAAPTGETTSK